MCNLDVCKYVGCDNEAWTDDYCSEHRVTNSMIQDITDFHRVMVPDQVDLKPSYPGIKIERLRINLIREEVVKELLPLMEEYNSEWDDPELLAEIADGICDSIVVLIGTALAYGIPLQACWDEVHRTNMAKAPGGVVIRREDGKVMKPEGWQPPDLVSIIKEAQK